MEEQVEVCVVADAEVSKHFYLIANQSVEFR